ncbi:MAG TPA: hypothetical protein VNW73_13370, partial [Ktedonobacteraceae bacterium]|nr:hypothetical protein [Ktedonobacteraceae bacterium]
QKVATLEFLKPSERLRLIDHYINYCQVHVMHITAEADDLVQRSLEWGPDWGPARLKAVLNVMQHMVDQWQLELDWAITLRERELARVESSDSAIHEDRRQSFRQTEDNYIPEGD